MWKTLFPFFFVLQFLLNDRIAEASYSDDNNIERNNSGLIIEEVCVTRDEIPKLQRYLDEFDVPEATIFDTTVNLPPANILNATAAGSSIELTAVPILLQQQQQFNGNKIELLPFGLLPDDWKRFRILNDLVNESKDHELKSLLPIAKKVLIIANIRVLKEDERNSVHDLKKIVETTTETMKISSSDSKTTENYNFEKEEDDPQQKSSSTTVNFLVKSFSADNFINRFDRSTENQLIDHTDEIPVSTETVTNYFDADDDYPGFRIDLTNINDDNYTIVSKNRDEDDKLFDEVTEEYFTTTTILINGNDVEKNKEREEEVEENFGTSYEVSEDDNRRSSISSGTSFENISETIKEKEEIKPDLVKKENLETISTLSNPFTSVIDEKNIRDFYAAAASSSSSSSSTTENSSDFIAISDRENEKYNVNDTFFDNNNSDIRSEELKTNTEINEQNYHKNSVKNHVDTEIIYSSTDNFRNYNNKNNNNHISDELEINTEINNQNHYTTEKINFNTAVDKFDSDTTKKTLILKIGESFSNVPKSVSEILLNNNNYNNNIKNKDDNLMMINVKYGNENSVNSNDDNSYLNLSQRVGESSTESADSDLDNKIEFDYKKFYNIKDRKFDSTDNSKQSGKNKRGGRNTDFQKLYRWFYRLGQDQENQDNPDGAKIEVRTSKCGNGTKNVDL